MEMHKEEKTEVGGADGSVSTISPTRLEFSTHETCFSSWSWCNASFSLFGL